MHFALAVSLLLASTTLAEPRIVEVATTSELRTALASASPGTRIAVKSGEYERFDAAGITGTLERPIFVAAADPKAPPVFRGMQFSDVAYFELVGITIRGAPTNGLNIDDGGTFETPSHHVVLRDIVVEDCGARGNEDGIKLSGLDVFRVENCDVARWGRAGSAVDMVGCHGGVIEGCTFRDSAENPASTGVQTKGGTRDVLIRSCRFMHAGQRAVNIGGSTALAYFRPKPESFEARDIVIEGCTFVGSEAPIAFVGVDGAIVRFNTFYEPKRWFLRILQETRETGFVPCRNGVFSDNLVVWNQRDVATPSINIGPHTAPETFTFARNYWFCPNRPEVSIPKLHVEQLDARGGADPLFLDIGQHDFRVRETSPARGYGAHAFAAEAKR